MMPSLWRWWASRFHSALAVGIRCAGQVGMAVTGFGSCLFSGRLPGLPAISFRVVGVGLRPRIAGNLSSSIGLPAPELVDCFSPVASVQSSWKAESPRFCPGYPG